MNGRLTTAILAALLFATFFFGYRISHQSGIQPGYFEKAEAPAYGVGGGIDIIGAGMSDEVQEHFRQLYEENDE